MIDIVLNSGIADVAFQCQEHFNGYAIRHVPDGLHDFLTWQVGVIESEFRTHEPRNNMPSGFRGTVTLFRLLGYGPTREEALEMAKRRKGRP